jgi:type II secretory ATPase GspE/PulE/Tfp pilus assembly ATPase PilB-like protein
MIARSIITFEEPVEFNLAANLEQDSTPVIREQVQLRAADEFYHATMRRSPQSISVGEMSDDPQRTAEFLASVEAQTSKPE